MVGDIAKVTKCIYTMLEDQQETYRAMVVTVEGMIAMQTIFVLIDPGSTHSYVTPIIADTCGLKGKKHVKS